MATAEVQQTLNLEPPDDGPAVYDVELRDRWSTDGESAYAHWHRGERCPDGQWLWTWYRQPYQRFTRAEAERVAAAIRLVCQPEHVVRVIDVNAK